MKATELITKLVAKLDYSYRKVLPRTNIVQVILKEIEYPSQKFGVLYIENIKEASKSLIATDMEAALQSTTFSATIKMLIAASIVTTAI